MKLINLTLGQQYQPSYLSGVDLALKRTNQKPLTEYEKNYRNMRLHHDQLKGNTISDTEKQKLTKIDDMAKYRPIKSRETGKKIINDFGDYKQQYKYDKKELDKFGRG